MLNAFCNDLFQRVITLNKIQQRSNLKKTINKIAPSNKRVLLDFGCGTGLFAKTILDMNIDYYGYDIDQRLIDYASALYKNAKFTTELPLEEYSNKFDIVIANCCFHHIGDDDLLNILDTLRSLLNEKGHLIIIDIMAPQNDTSIIRGIFRKLEQGQHVRTKSSYIDLTSSRFKIIDTSVERSNVFSMDFVPVYNDLVVIIASP